MLVSQAGHSPNIAEVMATTDAMPATASPRDVAVGALPGFRINGNAIGPCSLISARSRTRHSFDRSWGRAREEGNDLAMIYFVQSGTLRIARTCGESVARAGDVLILQSLAPFTLETRPETEGICEVLRVTAPMHRMRRVVGSDLKVCFYIRAGNRQVVMAHRILTVLFNDMNEVREEVAQQVLDAAISLIGDAIRRQDGFVPDRPSIAEARLRDVLRYIETHLSDPRLSAATVAAGCGISQRYVSALLRRRGERLPSVVWDKRLKAASQWLSTSTVGEASISEIAYRIGFKSPAHFSRMFKREFKVSPTQYREREASQHEGKGRSNLD